MFEEYIPLDLSRLVRVLRAVDQSWMCTVIHSQTVKPFSVQAQMFGNGGILHTSSYVDGTSPPS